MILTIALAELVAALSPLALSANMIEMDVMCKIGCDCNFSWVASLTSETDTAAPPQGQRRLFLAICLILSGNAHTECICLIISTVYAHEIYWMYA